MTDFKNPHVVKCAHCETPFVEADGRLCDCCPDCGEDDYLSYPDIKICRNCQWNSEGLGAYDAGVAEIY